MVIGTVEQVRKLSKRLREELGLATMPVGVRFCGINEQCDLAGFKRPHKDLGIRMALCQAINVVRTYGWSIAMGLDDSFCMVGPRPLV